MSGTKRADIKSGTKVAIVLKKDQRSGKLTEGIVQDILTKSASHPHGIKVRLQDGHIGRVKKIFNKESSPNKNSPMRTTVVFFNLCLRTFGVYAQEENTQVIKFDLEDPALEQSLEEISRQL